MSASSGSSSSAEPKALKPSSRYNNAKVKVPPSHSPRSPKLPLATDECLRTTLTSRPPDTARGTSLTWQETQSLARRVTLKVHRINLGKMHDNVVLADKRGNIDERMYDDLISFFFGFVPMVLHTQQRDPCVETGSELLVYRDLIKKFEDRPDRKNERVVRGEGRVHEWYTRPKEKRGLWTKLRGK